ncbi:MAG: phospholipid methyltransferase [Polaromonas sp.]|nr:phospholipid methyltransferase [Polaromonas sp.]
MHPLAHARIAEAGLAGDLVGLSADKVPLPDASFDTVLITCTLCTNPDAHSALLEMDRALKSGKPAYCEPAFWPAEEPVFCEGLDPHACRKRFIRP